MTANVCLRLLGPVQVEREGQLVFFLALGKPLALLGYLVAQRKPLCREHLADLLWPDLPTPRGRANLSWTLHKLSTVLPGCLEGTRHTVRFRRSEMCKADLNKFEMLVARGDPDALIEATSLYRGAFLEGLCVNGCADYELWLVGERERWRQRVEQALVQLAAHYVRQGRSDQALSASQRLLALAPWRECAHREVMRLLAASGQRGAALAQYQDCCRALQAELGVAPAAETIALYEQIRDDRVTPW
jgi:DNA-binding SARP family transcriptional activator